MIDEYVEIKAELSSSQKEWQSTLATAAENILTMATSTKSLCVNVPALYTEASLQIGFVLKLLSHLNCAGRFHSWNSPTNQVFRNVTIAILKLTSILNQLLITIISFLLYDRFQIIM